MQIVTVLLAILLPITLIEGPQSFKYLTSAMGSVRGTYDVLTFPFALPREEVLELIPESVRRGHDMLLPIDATTYRALTGLENPSNDADHIVLLQMGYQHRTGPGPDWIPKFSFNECKLEIPFIRHPLQQGSSQGKVTSMVYKQTMLFSNQIISISSSAIGIHSATTTFVPSSTPSDFSAESMTIEYTGKGYVQAKAQKAEHILDEQQNSLQILKDLVQAWWFGSGTGKTVQRFDFDFESASIKPTPYNVNVEINLKAFGLANSSPEWRSFSGLGWRSKLRLVSQSSSITNIQ